MTSHEKTLAILKGYFPETPEGQITADMKRFCPELNQEAHDGAPYLKLITEEPDPAEVVRMPSGWWRRLARLLFGR